MNPCRLDRLLVLGALGACSVAPARVATFAREGDPRTASLEMHADGSYRLDVQIPIDLGNWTFRGRWFAVSEDDVVPPQPRGDMFILRVDHAACHNRPEGAEPPLWRGYQDQVGAPEIVAYTDHGDLALAGLWGHGTAILPGTNDSRWNLVDEVEHQ